MNHLIAPSLLSANFANLQADINLLNESEADWIHCDVMDGVFVPNISFGLSVITAIAPYTQKPLDVHLMIIEPERYLEAFKNAGAQVITVHYEACRHLHRTVSMIRDLGCIAGVALNPHTPVSMLENILPYIDLILLMSVNPGFGGQQFIQQTYAKITKLKSLIPADQSIKIEIDGGVNLQNAARLLEAGADVLVAGNAIFADPNPKQVIKNLKHAV